ncbi:hypothetical protein [Mucilaginibacter sp. SG564]|uniref:hypothetical protein n=2 Tax=unclassified Mucilaginibacter TaxID=2617802 RepID=UPI001556DE56|nr:hypothetical protein [Mucilaginibacter sp. SG564]NOW97258.1 hypothetical protein [Mucilaginibacter sp. SG564]
MNLDQFNPCTVGFMRLNRNPFKAAPYLKTVLILMFTCFFGKVMGQHRSHEALTWGGGSGSGGGNNFESGYAVTFGAGIDAPLNYFKDIYKPSAAFNLGVARFMDKFTISLNVGYHNYQPKDAFNPEKITIEIANEQDNGTPDQGPITVFSNYRVFSGYASVVYNVDIADGARLYGGANLGGYYTDYSYLIFDPNSDQGGSVVTPERKNFYVAPRLGLIFGISDHIGVSVESTYNFYAPLKKANNSGGTFYTSVTGLASLVYKF